MKVLILGGSRFVGPYIVDALLKGGHELTLFNRGKVQTKYGEGVKFVKGDRDKGFDVKGHFDAVIDNCAYTGAQTKSALTDLDFGFFLHFGTAAAYKRSGMFPLTEESPLGDWPAWGDYNKGKAECEAVLKESGVKYASIRPVYILGPKNYIDRENFIYSRIAKGTPLRIPGNGEAVIQFVFAKDVAAAITLLTTKRIAGAFNCAADGGITLNGLVDEMGKLVGKRPVVEHAPDRDGALWNDEEFPFGNENFFCKNDKLKGLGVEFTPLLEGLREDYKGYYKKLIA